VEEFKKDFNEKERERNPERKRVSCYLPKADIEKLKSLGDGNFNRGIKICLNAFEGEFSVF
jgi:hypothetical protein